MERLGLISRSDGEIMACSKPWDDIFFSRVVNHASRVLRDRYDLEGRWTAVLAGLIEVCVR